MLVCFSGQIGSGKSSVSAAVGTALGWRRTGFGDYLRAEIARLGGDPTSREALQNLGQQLVAADADAFCHSVLDAGGFKPGDNFLIDGVRHAEIFRILARFAEPSIARLLFLSVEETQRLARVAERTDNADFARASQHSVEAQLQNELPDLAHAVVDAARPFQEVVASCLTEIEGWLRE